MKNNKSKFKIWLIIWRIVLIGLALFVLIWLVNKNFFPSGTWLIERSFCQYSLVISDLYPKDRAVKEGCSSRLIYEPVYFKVKLPVMFERIKVSMIYATKDNLIISLGLLHKRIKPTDWQFELKKLEAQPLGNSLFESQAEFAINSGFINDHNLEFMISAPKVRHGAYLEIKKIKLELFRQPLTCKEFFERSLEYLKDIFR